MPAIFLKNWVHYKLMLSYGTSLNRISTGTGTGTVLLYDEVHKLNDTGSSTVALLLLEALYSIQYLMH